jgi:hypothetical protein
MRLSGVSNLGGVINAAARTLGCLVISLMLVSATIDFADYALWPHGQPGSDGAFARVLALICAFWGIYLIGWTVSEWNRDRRS